MSALPTYGEIMGKLTNLMYDVRSFWQKPRKNEYVSYKEVFYFSVGGMGIKSLGSILSYMTLASTCLLFGTVYGLSPRHFVILTIITNIISLIKTPFVSMLVDNTHTKIGKFRPYLLWAGIPTVVGLIGMAYVPLEASPLVKCVLVGIFINLVTITQPVYNNAYMGISQIITPNSQERTRILSISEFLANLGPSLIQLLLPSIAGIFFGDDCIKNILTYRIFVPIFAISGFMLGLLCLYNTRERVLDTRLSTEKISFFKGCKELSKNRYFWIVSISKFFDGFKGGIGVLLAWVVTYQLGKSSMLGIVQTITSVGFTPGILLAPIFMSKMGRKNAAFVTHFLNALMALLMLFTFKRGFAFFVIALFCYNFASGPQYIIQTSLLSDGLDYHQDKYGTRLEGFAQNFMLMITTVGTILSTITFSFIYEKFGLVADPETGLTDYEILTQASVREPIIQWVVIVVLISGALATLPYLFCNLKSKDMIEIRERLEFKKFRDNGDFEGVEESVVREAYAKHLEQIELEHEADKAKLQAAKDLAEEKRLAAIKEREDFESSLSAKAEEMRSQGASEKEIKRFIKAERNNRKEQARAKTKEKLASFNFERKAFAERKKQFIKDDIARRKQAGERGYLRILAREAFEDMIIKENNKETNDCDNLQNT